MGVQRHAPPPPDLFHQHITGDHRLQTAVAAAGTRCAAGDDRGVADFSGAVAEPPQDPAAVNAAAADAAGEQSQHIGCLPSGGDAIEGFRQGRRVGLPVAADGHMQPLRKNGTDGYIFPQGHVGRAAKNTSLGIQRARQRHAHTQDPLLGYPLVRQQGTDHRFQLQQGLLHAPLGVEVHGPYRLDIPPEIGQSHHQTTVIHLHAQAVKGAGVNIHHDGPAAQSSGAVVTRLTENPGLHQIVGQIGDRGHGQTQLLGQGRPGNGAPALYRPDHLHEIKAFHDAAVDFPHGVLPAFLPFQLLP